VLNIIRGWHSLADAETRTCGVLSGKETSMIQGFHSPQTIDEAVALKNRYAERACFLGGGTDLNSSTFATEFPEQVISLAKLRLDELHVGTDEIRIGCGATFQTLLDAPGMPAPLREAALFITPRNVRNMATVGGNIASNKFFSALIPVLAAYDAKLKIVRLGGTTAFVPIMDHLASSDPSLIVEVVVPLGGRRVAVAKSRRSFCDIAMLIVGVGFELDAGNLASVRVAIGGVTNKVERLPAAEKWLEGSPLPERETLEAKVSSLVSPTGTIKGSAELKKYLAGVLVADALTRAINATGRA
jgi:putative selenate reductase FAD-binding subunit